MSLTKALRWDIQALGQRLASAANSEEQARRGSSNAKSRVQNDIELKLIIQDIRNLLSRIEDAVPLINLAITTSGATLSTNLPATISPSRLLQSSTLLTAGDSQYALLPTQAVQIGPTFTLSLYMLFSGHVRPQDEEGLRETTWKEVMHKARVKLLRVPLNVAYGLPELSSNGGSWRHTSGGNQDTPYSPTGENYDYDTAHISGEAYADEFAYQLSVIEDLDDDRVHSFEDDEAQPGPYEDVSLAGIREVVPIHEISKIFYADTGKILNIGNEGEPNNPVLLLRRDVNALPPRRMMERFRADALSDDEDHEHEHIGATNGDVPLFDHSQSEIDAQLQREHRSSSVMLPSEPNESYTNPTRPWRLPGDLDPEWMAFEVHVESESSDSEETTSEADTSSTRPAAPSREQSLDPQMTTALSNLRLNERPRSIPQQIRPPSQSHNQLIPQSPLPTTVTSPTLFPAIRTSLSLLETLLRLSSLQQFQQTSHLAINDELLHFFLEESSTTGAGADSEERRRVRREARARVGFDPYDESPVKRRGEDYQYQYEHPNGRESRPGSEALNWETYPDYNAEPSSSPRSRWANDNDRYDDSWPHPHRLPLSQTSRDPTPETPPLLLKHTLSRSSSSPRPRPRHASATPDRPTHAPSLGARGYSSPPTPSGGGGLLKGRQAVLRRDVVPKRGSPLGETRMEGERDRPKTGLTDEGLGTSPGFAVGLGVGDEDKERGADVGLEGREEG